MELGLKGKVVMVTGGGTGIGQAIAAEFAREGCVVWISGRRMEKLEETRDVYAKEGLKLIPYVLDVTNLAAVEKCMEDMVGKSGSIDIWVNNAGFGKATRIEDVDDEHWDNTINANMKALLITAKVISRQMKKQKSGVFMNATSVAVKNPLASNSVYAAAKAGAMSFTRTFAAELAPYGIRVNSYSPGMIVTEMSKRHIARDHDKLIDTIALRRFGEPEDLAKPIVFLCSDAASFITAVDLEIAGGRNCTQNNGDMWRKAGDEAIVPKAVNLIPSEASTVW